MKYSEYYRKKNIKVDYKFIKWINKVEVIINNKLECDLLDIPDYQYMVSYELGLSPGDVAKEILENPY